MGRRGVLVLVGIAAAALFLVLLVRLTLQSPRHGVEACAGFRGATSCAKAWAATREEALSTAMDIACSQIASGMGDVMSCRNQSPERLRWLDER